MISPCHSFSGLRRTESPCCAAALQCTLEPAEKGWGDRVRCPRLREGWCFLRLDWNLLDLFVGEKEGFQNPRLNKYVSERNCSQHSKAQCCSPGALERLFETAGGEVFLKGRVAPTPGQSCKAACPRGGCAFISAPSRDSFRSLRLCAVCHLGEGHFSLPGP